MPTKTKKRNGLREIPDELWNLIEPLLPPDKPPGADGRPRVFNRTVLNGILYVLRTGCPWKMVPRTYSSGSTCHLRFQTWVRGGVFQRIWRVVLEALRRPPRHRLALPVDGQCHGIGTRQRRGSKRKKPYESRQTGTKRHQLTDAQGLPLAVTLCPIASRSSASNRFHRALDHPCRATTGSSLQSQSNHARFQHEIPASSLGDPADMESSPAQTSLSEPKRRAIPKWPSGSCYRLFPVTYNEAPSPFLR